MKEARGFEQSLKRLEAITRKLEGDDVSLDESLVLFEEGVKLVKQLQARLTDAERRVEILVRDASGGVRLESFDEDDAGAEDDGTSGDE